MLTRVTIVRNNHDRYRPLVAYLVLGNQVSVRVILADVGPN